MEVFFIIVFLVLAIVVFSWVFGDRGSSKEELDQIMAEGLTKHASIVEHLESLDGFSFDPKRHLSGSTPDGATRGFAVDEMNKRICMYTVRESHFSSFVIPWNKLMAVELVEDGDSVSKIERGSQIGGAVAGGLLFGGVGAIVGGLSADRVSSGRVQQIRLKLSIRDLDNPIFTVVMMNFPVPVTKTDPIYLMFLPFIEKWAGMLNVILNDDGHDTRE